MWFCLNRKKGRDLQHLSFRPDYALLKVLDKPLTEHPQGLDEDCSDFI